MTVAAIKDAISIWHVVSAVGGGVIVKAYQWAKAEWAKAKAAEKKLVADVKKDI